MAHIHLSFLLRSHIHVKTLCRQGKSLPCHFRAMDKFSLLQDVRARLKPIQSENEARWIVDFAETYPQPAEKIEEIISRRLKHEPLAYIFGSWPFCDGEFAVGPGVLIPRPETEELVSIAVTKCESFLQKNPAENLRLGDFGAGTGCIGLSVAKALMEKFPQAKLRVTLVEASPHALPYLRQNVESFSAAHPQVTVEVFFGTWMAWSAQHPQEKLFALLSNPPYLTHAELELTEASVHEFEPVSALLPDDIAIFPDASGPYRELVYLSGKHLIPGGFLLCELGPAQALWLADYARDEKIFHQGELLKDLCQKSRFFCAVR